MPLYNNQRLDDFSHKISLEVYFHIGIYREYIVFLVRRYWYCYSDPQKDRTWYHGS